MKKQIEIVDGMPFTKTDKGMHRSSVAELVEEIERLRHQVHAGKRPKLRSNQNRKR